MGGNISLYTVFCVVTFAILLKGQPLWSRGGGDSRGNGRASTRNVQTGMSWRGGRISLFKVYLVKLPDDLTFVNMLEILVMNTTIWSPHNEKQLGIFLYI